MRLAVRPSRLVLRVRTVELNALGWTVLLGSGGVVGVVVGLGATREPLVLAAAGCAGALGSWALALGLDARRDGRFLTNVAVSDPHAAVDALRAMGIEASAGEGTTPKGKRIGYVTVRQRHAHEARTAVAPGPRGRRAQRRDRQVATFPMQGSR